MNKKERALVFVLSLGLGTLAKSLHLLDSWETTLNWLLYIVAVVVGSIGSCLIVIGAWTVWEGLK